MSARSRRICVGLLLVLYAGWPLVHQQLVSRYRVDPWKLAGWAMYSAPSARVRITVLGVDAAGRRVRIDPKKSLDFSRATEAFVARRRTLGLFSEPESLVQKMLESYPDYREWTVVVDQVGLTPENFFGVIHRAVYRYPIDAGRLASVDIDYPLIPAGSGRTTEAPSAL